MDIRGAALAVEVLGLDDERIAFPAAARIAEPGLGAGIDGLAADRNHARLMNHFETDHDVTRRLQDLDAVVVVGGQHRCRQAARDAPVPVVEVGPMIERDRHPAAAHQRAAALAFRGESGELAVRRIDDQRGQPVRLTPFDPMAHAHLVRIVFLVVGALNARVLLLPRRELFVRQETAVAELGRTLQRHARQMTDRPHAAQIGFAPFRDGLLPGGRVALLRGATVALWSARGQRAHGECRGDSAGDNRGVNSH